MNFAWFSPKIACFFGESLVIMSVKKEAEILGFPLLFMLHSRHGDHRYIWGVYGRKEYVRCRFL